MKNKIALIFLSGILFLGCNSGKSRLTDDSLFYEKWNEIVISLNKQEITIGNSYYNTTSSKSWDYRIKDSVTKTLEHINDDYQRFNLSQPEKDSVYYYVFNLITDPINPKDYVAIYDSYVTFTINYKQTKLSINYYYIKSWRTLSHDSERIFSILSNKIKII